MDIITTCLNSYSTDFSFLLYLLNLSKYDKAQPSSVVSI